MNRYYILVAAFLVAMFTLGYKVAEFTEQTLILGGM